MNKIEKNLSTNKTPHLLETSGVEVKFLTTGSEGITVKTKNTLARKALSRPSLNNDQASRLRDAFRSESRFQGVDEYEKVRSAHGAHSQEALSAWQAYRERAVASKKLGIRNLEFDRGTDSLSVDIMNVPYPVYKLLSKPESDPEVREFAEATGTAATIITSDNKLIIQHRLVAKPKPEGGLTRGNALYADIPGASAAGMLDVQPGEMTSVPAHITTESITGNILKEIDEELGLDNDDIRDIKIVGIASDKVQPHDEFLFFGTTPLTLDQVYEKSKHSNKNRVLGDADFEEKFLAIEATPDAIKALLTEVRTPMPSTHAASVFATGYALVLEDSGADKAKQWCLDVQDGMQKNEDAINQTIKEYYENNPDSIDVIPARYHGKSVPKRNLNGYAPEYTPEEQGLPSLDSELHRTGLDL